MATKKSPSPSEPKLLPAVAGASLINQKTSLAEHILKKGRLVEAAFGVLVIWSTLFVGLYLTKTSFMNISVAGVSAGRIIAPGPLQQHLEQATNLYKLKLQPPDTPAKSFSLKETGLSVDIPASIEQAERLQRSAPFPRRLQFWQTLSVPLILRVDEAAFSTFLTAQASEVVKPPQNAALNVEQGIAKITPAATGQSYTIKNTRRTILRGVAQLQNDAFSLELVELKPTLTAGDLQAAKQKAATILAQTVTINIADKVVQVTPAEISNWIELTPVDNEKTVDVTVNSGKVLEYLVKLSKPYITVRRAEVVSTQSDGSSVVLVTGQNGSDVNKKEAVAADIAGKVLAGQSATVDLPITYAVFKTIIAQAYDKWLAVDVSSKRLYAYEKTNLVHTALISAGAPGTPTVLGQYAIYSKFSKQDMRGQNVDGSRYFQPNVQWVNYFYKDYAIHGNYWRPTSYFGNVNSSHGCVGTFNSDAEWVYNWAPIGTPVIVYD